MQSTNENILPIVMDRSPRAETQNSFLSVLLSSIWATSIPTKWKDYVRNTNTKKDSEGHFIVAENLREFLLPYQALINNPPPSVFKIPIFFDFFAQLEDRALSEESRELYLAKVVVLLQLLADPNMSISSVHFFQNFLWSTFENKQAGLDILNLLFSYGLDYQKFLFNLSAFLRKKTEISRTEDDLLQILMSQENEKNRIAEEKPNTIYRPILDILPENEYIKTYRLLSSAYSYYKNADYTEAIRCYDEASQFLNKFVLQTGLSKTLRDDYLLRFRRTVEYRDKCEALLSRKNKPTMTADHPAAWNLWSRDKRFTYDPEESSHDLLLKKVN